MNKIIFLLGVAGSGKTTTLHNSGFIHHPNFVYVPSYTTREMRPGEINGEKYFHISQEDFTKKIEQGDFLEYAYVHQTAWYGTEYASITNPLHQGKNSIKEMEILGLTKIQEEHKIDGLFISLFLDIPLDVMRQRIMQRHIMSDEELEKRLESAKFEREEAKHRCDYIINAIPPIEVVTKEFTNICLSYSTQTY